jgi:hypothetical protein
LELLTKYQIGLKYGKMQKSSWQMMGMQLKLHMVTIEDLVPQDHFLRKPESVLDLSYVYEETRRLYSHRDGRPPFDPVMLVKYLLVGYLYGIPSERQIEQRIQTDNALRWYLGAGFIRCSPGSQYHLPASVAKTGLPKDIPAAVGGGGAAMRGSRAASGRVVATAFTHVKANASRSSEELVELPVESEVYWERLDACEEDALERLAEKLGHRRKKRTRQIKKDSRRSHKRISSTDPEAGHLKRPGKPEGPHYLAHQTVDTDHGVILDVTVTTGDVNDSAPYLEQLERI